jgi:hypothetical protein
VHDELHDFLTWFLAQGPVLGKVPVMSAVNNFGQDNQGGHVMSGIWYRNKQFQVELFIVSGPCIIPEHTHPNVDSYEVLLGGQIRFSRDGKWLIPETYQVDVSKNGTSPYRGETVRVSHNTPHGGVVGDGGAMFFSVQHWLNGIEPHSVGFDWSGITSSQSHLDKLKFGDAFFVEQKTPQMAATLEVNR